MEPTGKGRRVNFHFAEWKEGLRDTRTGSRDYSANVPEDFCANPDDSCGLFRIYNKLSSKSYLFPFKD
ncbi:hypothetical protein HPP92_024029 [Vanilla planifolia]|uniref:Uncharacterized protein n=1 Tax=Vanilla planifolia TaxID=51239 RepID=A0A835PPZ3_VANPL|nr:hypothetical protein HPP92_024029 [Vanilla planifolia]